MSLLIRTNTGKAKILRQGEREADGERERERESNVTQDIVKIKAKIILLTKLRALRGEWQVLQVCLNLTKRVSVARS